MRRFTLVAALIGALLVASTLPAWADPKAEVFEVTCDGGIPDGTITANSGNGLWTPGFATASTGVYIPYGFEFTATFFPEGGGEVDLGTQSFMKNNPPKNTQSHLHGTCSFSGVDELVDDPDLGTGLLVFEATANVFWTGK